MVTNTEQDNTMVGAAKNFNVRMPEDRISELEQLAKQLDRTRNWLINDAVRWYLEVQKEQIAEIERRLAEIDRGEAEFVPHDVVVKRGRERLQAKLSL
jgi:predicted transcriptional regulator